MIVQQVGISRGILYHYFKGKEDLFNYLNYYSFAKGFEDVDQFIDWNKDDIIERVCDITKYRLDVIEDYPYMIEFSEKYKDRIVDFADVNVLRAWREKFYKYNIDYSKFKGGDISIESALHVIKWTFRGGLYKELLEKRQDDISESVIIKAKEECTSYYKLLAANFYNK